ncbi:MAG: [FeFe] hydrogenase H-cluster maturation GTPase HydF, partial [Lentisphaeria bacterium]
MNKVSKSMRLHIAIFGRTNVGKSSLLNMIAGQHIAITSNIAGTTTDVVEKSMELLPLGPVVFIDTAGTDDSSALGESRIQKTMQVFNRTDIAIIITENNLWGPFEENLISSANHRNIPILIVINKCDQHSTDSEFIKLMHSKAKSVVALTATAENSREKYLNALKLALLKCTPEVFIQTPILVGDLIAKNGTCILVIPVDSQAPKGRLILPQVQTIRDLLDHDATAIMVKETQYLQCFEKLKNLPDLAICDSQIVKEFIKSSPPELKCTTFSIVFSRIKGDLPTLAKGAATIKNLKDGDKILIAESCTHHAGHEDIGRVKIPNWLKHYTQADISFDICAGHDFPNDVTKYQLIILCGGCMHNR